MSQLPERFKPSDRFMQTVRERWGNPWQVVEAAQNELFRHQEGGFDHDDQVDAAAALGILAGRHESGCPEDFIAAFEAFLAERFEGYQ